MAEEHVFDLIPGYALGALDEDERKLVDEHLADCKTCQAEFQSYKIVVDDLPLGVKISSPPPGLKAKILAQVTEERKPTASQEGIGFWEAVRNALVSHAPAWGALSLVVVLALVVSNLLLWRQLGSLRASNQQVLTTIAMNGTELTPEASGMLVMSVDGEYGVLVVDRLPHLDNSEQYQLWLIQDGQRTSGGVFSVNDEGYGSLLISSVQPLSSYSAFGVTVEPAGGSPGPTGVKVLGGET